MKTLNIPLEDKEFEELEKLKGDMTWKEFLFNASFAESKNRGNSFFSCSSSKAPVSSSIKKGGKRK